MPSSFCCFSSSANVIDSYFIGNSPALGKAATTVLSRNPIWTLIIAVSSVYYSSAIFPFPSLTRSISVSSKDKLFLCKDDPACKFQTYDPASLTRHRKRFHNYIPKASSSRKAEKPYKAPACRGRKASISSSSSSVASINSSTSSIHPRESLLFSDSPQCSYQYAWDKSPLPESDFLAAEPETEQYEFQFPYQDQQEESLQAQSKDFLLPLQLPNMEQAFPGYGTTGQLYGSYGLDFGLTQPLQGLYPEANNDICFGLSINGSPILQYHNLPPDSFQLPNEIDCSAEICSPVRTGGLELDMEPTSGLDIRFDSGIPGNTDFAQMTSSSCDFNSLFFDLTPPSPKPADLAVFTDATNAHLHHVPPAPISYADVNCQTYAQPDFIGLSTSGVGYFDHCQSTDVKPDDLIDLSPSGLDYFDPCRWDFGFDPASGIVQAPPDGNLENVLKLYS